MLNKIIGYFQEKKRLKYQKLRKRNAQLRAQGIEPVKKGWGKMINSGYGGLNNADRTNKGKLENTLFRINEAKNIKDSSENNSNRKNS